MLPYWATPSIADLIGDAPIKTLAIAFVAGEGRDRQRTAVTAASRKLAQRSLSTFRKIPLNNQRHRCHACGHKTIVPNAALLQGRPGYTRLMALQRQLRCRKCGTRGKGSLDVEFRPRD